MASILMPFGSKLAPQTSTKDQVAPKWLHFGAASRTNVKTAPDRSQKLKKFSRKMHKNRIFVLYPLGEEIFPNGRGEKPDFSLPTF